MSTSSIKVNVPSASSPNSNLVSAMMMPLVSAKAAAASYSAMLRSRMRVARSAPIMATVCSKVMFSSWSPTAALAAGV